MPFLKMVTIRVTPELHRAFAELAYRRRRSMNALGVELLTQAVKTDPAAADILEHGWRPADVRADRRPAAADRQAPISREMGIGADE